MPYAVDSSGRRVTDRNAYGAGGLEVFAGLGVANTFTRGITIDGTVNEIQLTVEAVAGQSAELIQWQNSAATYLGSISANGLVSFVLRDAAATTAETVLSLAHNSSDTPADGFGSNINFYLESSTTEDVQAGAVTVTWATATHASRKARIVVSVYDTAAREGLRIEGNGTDALLAVGGAVLTTTRLTVYGTALDKDVLNLTTPATNDDPNYRVLQNRAATTDATVTTLSTIAITASKTYLIEARVLARRTGGAAGTADDGAVYIRRAMVTTKAGTVTISAVQDGLTQEDQAAWDCTLSVSGTNILVRVTGALDNNVTWHSTTTVQEVGT